MYEGFRMKSLDCSSAQKLMSPFIDSMATAGEVESLELHVSVCPPCQRQLQSFKSVRSLLARMERPAVPEDMVLETRVRLSHERNKNFLVRFENKLCYLFKPVVFPALFGVSVTMLFFGILLGTMASDTSAVVQDRLKEQPVFALYKSVHNDDPNWVRLASNQEQHLDEPLNVETQIGNEGRVIDYKILPGPDGRPVRRDPEVNGWMSQVLSLAKFTPATAFGRPVESKIILSFVAVRN